MIDLKKAIEDCGGIQPPHLAFYMESIRFNLEAAMNSVEYLANFIEMTNEKNGEYEMTHKLKTEILDHLQNLLTNAASLSRYFWPSRTGKNELHKKRGETLRTYFVLDDLSPLRDRKLRNQLEHFDENLDNHLWAKPITGHIIPSYVGGELKSNGVPTHLFRAFYVDSGVFETLGVRYDIQPLVDELCQLYRRYTVNGV